MIFRVEVRIPGTPVAKGRPRFSRGCAYTPSKTRGYEKTVSEYAQIAMLTAKQKTTLEPVRVELALVFPVPKSWSEKRRSAALVGQILPTTGSDVDNCAKSILDGLNGVVFDDDAQVVDLHVMKTYGLTPECIARITGYGIAVPMEIAA